MGRGTAVSSRLIRSLVVFVTAAATIGTTAAGSGAASHPSQTYTIQVDAMPPTGEAWAFLRFFPGTPITVRQGDVLSFMWAGAEAPHTVTLVGDADPEAWRTANQGPGGPYESPIPDTQAGGDDEGLILNPKEVARTDPTCGTSATPCAFGGTNVVSSGILFSNPSQQPSFAVRIDAPVGSYSILCLLHPGMEVNLNVVADTGSVPTPQQVASKAAKQVKRAIKIDGAAASEQSQAVAVVNTASGTIIKLSAGGFSNNVTADEFPEAPIVATVGDKIKFTATPEIHTVTFPRKKALATVPFIVSQCEQPGADAEATSPADCSDPTKFRIAVNGQAITPTASNRLRDPKEFVNSGLLVGSARFTFVARKPGVYRFACVVHGPTMIGTIKVQAA